MNGKYMTISGKWRDKSAAWCDRCCGTGTAHAPNPNKPGYSKTFDCPDCTPDYNFMENIVRSSSEIHY